MKKAARIVELTGLAGAGKSTIAQILGQYSKQVLIGKPPDFRRIHDVPFFARNTFSLLPTLFHLGLSNKGGRWLNRREVVASMVILQGWHRVLRHPRAYNTQVVVLDQGPVFSLMLLHLFGPDSLRGPRAKEWWVRTGKQWADTLDTVIWLDAATATLVKRIRARDVWHSVQERSDAEALEYLGEYRESFEHVFSLLMAQNSSLKVISFDTGRESRDSIVEKLLLELGLRDSRKS